MSSTKMTIERLQAVDDAWGRKDVDASVEFNTDECEYRASVGQEPGKRFIGKENVQHGFERLLDHDSGSECLPGNVYVYVDRGAAEWAYKRIDEFGQSMVVKDCDLFALIGDKVRLENPFRRCST